MEWIPFALFFVAALFVLAVVGYRLLFPGVPSVALIREIAKAIRELQLAAADDIDETRTDGTVSGVATAAAERQTARVGDVVRFVYTIERDGGDVVHLVSSQLLARRSEKFQIQCMLVVMLLFSRQMESAGLDPKQARFEVQKSPLGTHFLALRLAQEEHEALMRTEPTLPAPAPSGRR